MRRLSPAAHRDLDCACCGFRLYNPADNRPLTDLISEHHRILHNTADNRPSNKLLLQGSATVGCHWRWHNVDRVEAERRGYIIRDANDKPWLTVAVPVWYRQPMLGRTGWYRLDDDGDLEAVDAPVLAHARELAREWSGDGLENR